MEKTKKKLPIHTCDFCGKRFAGINHPVYDENYNKLRVFQCYECWVKSIQE